MSRTTAIAALLLVPSLALAGRVKTYTASARATTTRRRRKTRL